MEQWECKASAVILRSILLSAMIMILRLKYWYAVICAVSKFDGSVYELCSLDQILQNYCGYLDKRALLLSILVE